MYFLFHNSKSRNFDCNLRMETNIFFVFVLWWILFVKCSTLLLFPHLLERWIEEVGQVPQVSVDVLRCLGRQAGVFLALIQPAHVQPVRLHVHVELGQRLVHLVRRRWTFNSSEQAHYCAHCGTAAIFTFNELKSWACSSMCGRPVRLWSTPTKFERLSSVCGGWGGRHWGSGVNTARRRWITAEQVWVQKLWCITKYSLGKMIWKSNSTPSCWNCCDVITPHYKHMYGIVNICVLSFHSARQIAIHLAWVSGTHTSLSTPVHSDYWCILWTLFVFSWLIPSNIMAWLF